MSEKKNIDLEVNRDFHLAIHLQQGDNEIVDEQKHVCGGLIIAESDIAVSK